MTVYLSSSAITAVNYNENTKVLTITFTSGKSYDYFGVPESVYRGLISAYSAGEYFNEHIKDQYSLSR